MGIDLRLQQLKQNAKDDERRSNMEAAAKRLVDLSGMGKQYKVLGVLANVDCRSVETWPFGHPNIAPVTDFCEWKFA